MHKSETQHLKELFLETYTHGYKQGEQDAFTIIINAFEQTKAYKHLVPVIKQIQLAAKEKPLNLTV